MHKWENHRLNKSYSKVIKVIILYTLKFQVVTRCCYYGTITSDTKEGYQKHGSAVTQNTQ